VLVGINLLREGLDIPEVALVAVLDADKEGFLRSESSLIQTIGRAARHLQGKAILYADKVTGSMERAIEETNRRRTIQEKFNKENSIKPKGIKKNIADIMEGARSVKGKGKTKRKLDKLSDIKFEPVESFDNPEKVRKEIIKLEDEMYKYAKNLEFEEAATYRDRVEELKKQLLLS
jgi:excinuclease ABC subunit B